MGSVSRTDSTREKGKLGNMPVCDPETAAEGPRRVLH